MQYEENIFGPSDRLLETAILVLPESNMLSLAAALDPMRAANRRAGKLLFKWDFYTVDDRPAPLTSGLSIPAHPINTLNGADLLIVIAGFNIDSHTPPSMTTNLRRVAARCHAVAGIDGGPWVMAKARLLDQHRATTHWEDLEEFANRFDQIEVLRDRYVISGRMITSGGAAPAMDLMLHLISARHGRDLSTRVASAFIYDPSEDGTAPQRLTPTARLSRRHPLVARAVALMDANIEDPIPINTLADTLALSPRLLEQRFNAALGQSPQKFYASLRLSEAYRLAKDTSLSVQDIALRTGFASHASFGRAFQAAHGTSVRALRAAQ